MLSRGQPTKFLHSAAFAQRTGKARPLFVEPVEPYIWRGRLGIEPTQKVLETSSPSLEHSPPYSRSSRLSCGFLRLSACLFATSTTTGYLRFPVPRTWCSLAGMEPRGGSTPPHVHGVVLGRRFRFCYSTRHIWHTFSDSRSSVGVCQPAAS